jgi:hypothetical protein
MSGIGVWVPVEIPRLGRGSSVSSKVRPCSLESMFESTVASQSSVAQFATDLACRPWARMGIRPI